MVIGVFAAVMGIASAEINTTYNETGRYIEGINVTVNTSESGAFNRSDINVPLTFPINNTLNPTATNFSVDNQTGLTTNATDSMANNSWFWVNASSADTYWVNVSNNENSSEYVNFTVEYSNITITIETIEIKPETLNLASKGVFTAFITNVNVTAINISTVECGCAPAVRGMVSEKDNGTYIAKFNRSDLVDVTEGGAVMLTVTGEPNGGTPFEGKDTIRVIIDKGKGKVKGLGFLPDQRFYGVKRWSERVHMFFTFDEDAKARLHIHFSEVRIAEAKAMAELGKPEWAEGLMEDYVRELNETYKCMQRQKQRGKPVMDLAEYVCNATDEQTELLSDFVDEVPGQEKTHIAHAMNASYRGHTRAMREIAGENPERAAQLCAEFAEKRIDTGINYTHSDLDANYKGGRDYVNNDADPMDDNGHGTHCAGIVAAEDNGEGVVGVAPEVYLYAVKVLDSGGSGDLSDVIAGIQWSQNNGMQVISMSLGTDTDYQPFHDACDAAYAAGIVVVAAAGNDGNPPGKGDNVDYPARYDSVIAVAATDSNDERARWSSTGPDVELAAPGVSIYSTWLDGGYATKSGTSMACPHVSGTAALVIASGITDKNDNGIINDEVRVRLQETAEDLGTTGKDNLYGYGLVDAFKAAPGDLVPVVGIVNPAEGSTVSGTIGIEADASDDVGVTKVDFYIDDTLLAIDREAPYSCSWDSTSVADGSHIIKATATDTIEQTASDTITVDVDNVDDPPTVEITSPVDGATVSGTITIEASASDDKGISKVDFFINDTLLATDTEAPYNASWDTTTVADGSHSITAIATDTAAQTASDTNGVTVDNTPPVNVMHVSAIDMWCNTAGPNYFIYTKVIIVDSNETPVAEATVYLEMTLPDGSEASGSGSTIGDGTVTFKLKSRQTGMYNSTVTNVTKTDNWTYDSGANEVTSDSITV